MGALLLATAVSAQVPPATTTDEPLTLNEAFRQALENNVALERAKYEVQASEAQRRAIFSAVLPRINASGALTYNTEEVQFGEGTDARTILPAEDWNYRLSLSQPIYAGNRERRAYEQAKITVLNAREGVEAAKESLLVRVAGDYLGIVAGDALMDVERRNVEVATRRLEHARNLFSAGEVTRVEVLRAEAAVKAAQRRLTAAQQSRETAAGRLRIDMNREGDIRVVSPSVGALATGDEATLFTAAEAARPEIRQAFNNVEIARLEVAKQRGAYLPVITADAAYINQKSTFPTDSYGTASLRVNVPIYQGGEVAARVAVARSRQAQAELALAELRQVVREDIRKALLDVRSAETSLALAQEQLQAAEAEYEQIFEAYRAQEATSLDVQAAESNLADARRAVVISRLDLDLARLRVAYAAGTLEETVTATTAAAASARINLTQPKPATEAVQ